VLEDRCVPASFVYDVNTLGDGIGVGPGVMTLRQAITNANNAAPGDNVTITFHLAPLILVANPVVAPPPPLPPPLEGAITLESALPTITHDVTIQGPGFDLLRIARDTAAAKFSVFKIASNVGVAIQDLTIADGNADKGGGIYNSGHLTLINSNVSWNHADTSGGGLYDDTGASASVVNDQFSLDDAWAGGAIYEKGSLILSYSQIFSNTASVEGGGLSIEQSGNVEMLSSSIDNNYSNNVGGGIDCAGTLLMTGGDLTANKVKAGSYGAGLYVNNSDGTTSPSVQMIDASIKLNSTPNGVGGGICILEGSVSLTGCTVSDNVAATGNGVAYSKANATFTSTNCFLWDEVTQL
jgi:hypothetical protein